MKRIVKRGGFDTNDEDETDTEDITTSSPYEYRGEENAYIEDTDDYETNETNENNENIFFNEEEEFVLPVLEDIEDYQNSIANNQAAYANEIYGANQTWGGKRRRKSKKVKRRKSKKVKRRKSRTNKRKSNKRKSRKVKRRKSNKRRYMRGGQPALTAGTVVTDRVTGYVEPIYRI
jgi:hypothetical protein